MFKTVLVLSLSAFPTADWQLQLIYKFLKRFGTSEYQYKCREKRPSKLKCELQIEL